MILMEMMLEVVIGVLVMEVDKLADEVTNMDVDKVTNMMAKITNEDFLASWDAIEPGLVSNWVTLLNWLDWCDPG